MSKQKSKFENDKKKSIENQKDISNGDSEKSHFDKLEIESQVDVKESESESIDNKYEKKLSKLREKLDKDIEIVGKKLSNEGFVARAPEAVVAKERQKISDAEVAKERLAGERAKVASM